MNYPAKFAIHKGVMGAFQAGVIPPTWQEEVNEKDNSRNHKVTREGTIMIEMAPFLEERDNNKYYDWKNKKVSFGLGISDICQMVGSTGEIKLIHQNERTGESKMLIITQGIDKYVGTYLMTLSVALGNDKKSAKISFSAGEWNVFLTLLRSQLPGMLGWDEAG